MPEEIPRPSINIEDEMRQSYMDYAMSVIVGRALPDARDGLKPVHRRILFAMSELGLEWNRAFKKSARVVGDVIGKYHPHGDLAVYDALVRMAQEFSLRYPLVDGQGNFGSVDGDPPAAMRYTEARMARVASEMLADIDKETVDFGATYDDENQEPRVLPSRLPNLLVNGSSGIAVGMATNVPPHNLGEIVDGLLALIENPQVTIDELMTKIPGPDFPTGGILCGKRPIEEAFKTGRGVLTVRARTEVERDEKRDRESIIVTEIPFQVNKARLIERIAELVNQKTIEGISDLRDESDRHGMRVVIELKRDAMAEVVLNQLYRHTPLQDSFGVILLAIVDGRPKVLTLKEALEVFLDHRRDVVRRRTEYDLREAEKRLHVLEGFRIALDNLDAIIALIRAAPDPQTARSQLVERFALSEIQAQEILNLRLQRLTSMERDKILEEHRLTEERIREYRRILSDDRLVDELIAGELEELRGLYGDARRTEITAAVGEFRAEDMIPDDDMVVSVSHEGFIKRNPVTTYRAQKRGGRGIIGAAAREEDFVEHLFVASAHTPLLFFTTTGKVYGLKVHEIPVGGRAARGKAIVNLLPLESGERVSAVVPLREYTEGRFLTFATCRGVVKRTDVVAYKNLRSVGLRAINLTADDELIHVAETDGKHDIVLSTRSGSAIRFPETAVRPMGRVATGVRGIRLDKEDEVVGMAVVEPGATLLTVSDKGYGKRTSVDEYRRTNRGGKGIITMKVTERTGPVLAAATVDESDELMLITTGSKMIRLRIAEVRMVGRNAQGVRLVNLEGAERVAAVAHVAESDAETDAVTEPAGDESPAP